MVTFTATLIGAAAVFARVASAVPMEYGYVYISPRVALGERLNFLFCL
jgi:hypothetical protein